MNAIENDRSYRYALSLANYLGLSVFPCHTITSEGVCSCGHIPDGAGGCSCGAPAHKGTCESPGKHPATFRGFKDASSEETKIRTLWDGAPENSNIAVATGNGLVVVDCDIKPGVDGRAALAELEAKHGLLPPTLTAQTGSGGLHLYFRFTGAPINNSASKIGPGIDIRGDGGYVVCPPSKHKSGGLYSWIDELTPIADAPEWLTDAVRRRPAPRVTQGVVVDINSAPTARITDGDNRRYALGALRGVCDDLRATPNGQRHTEAFNKAFKMGGFVGSAALAASEVESELLSATRAAGWDKEREFNTLTAIRDGIKAGQNKPLAAPARPTNGTRQQSGAVAYADLHTSASDDERAAIQCEAPNNVVPINMVRHQSPTEAALPSDSAREDGLLATLLFRDGSLDEATAIVRPEHFHGAAHAFIYRAMLELWERGETYTANDVGQLWRATGSPHQYDTGKDSAAAVLARLTDDSLLIPVAALKRECEVIRDLARQRDMVVTCRKMALEGTKRTQDIQGYLDAALADVERAAEPPTIEAASTAAECAKELLVEVYEAAERGPTPKGVLTGLRQLDAATGGLIRKKQLLLAGRPSMGKTALASDISMNIADTLAPDGVRRNGVLILSLETPKDDLTKRMVFRLGAISLHEFNTGALWTRGNKEDILAQIERASAAFAELPILIHYKPGLTVAEMRRVIRYVRAMWRKAGITLALVVVDYIQLMDASQQAPRNANREQLVSTASLKTRELAQDEDVPILALAQLNRAVDKQKDKRPVLADLRESGSLEMNADTIIFVHREEQYLREETPEEFQAIAELIIAKNKNGPTKTVYTGFIKQTMGFWDSPKSNSMVRYE